MTAFVPIVYRSSWCGASTCGSRCATRITSFSSVFSAASTAASELSRPTESGNNNPGKRIVFFSGRTGNTCTSFVAILLFLSRGAVLPLMEFISKRSLELRHKGPGIERKPNSRPCSICPQLFRWDCNENVAATSIYQKQNRVPFRLLHKALVILFISYRMPVYLHDDIPALQGFRRGRVFIHAVYDNALCGSGNVDLLRDFGRKCLDSYAFQCVAGVVATTLALRREVATEVIVG